MRCVHSYAAILEAFATMATSSGSSSGGHTTSILRLSPLARGPEMGSAVWQLPQLTFEALRNAYGMIYKDVYFCFFIVYFVTHDDIPEHP